MPDSALFYVEKADEVGLKNDKTYFGMYLNTLGEIYNSLGNEHQGLALMRQGIIESTKSNNARGVLAGLLSVAQFYRKKGLLDSTIAYTKQALSIAQGNKYISQVFEAANLMSGCIIQEIKRTVRFTI